MEIDKKYTVKISFDPLLKLDIHHVSIYTFVEIISYDDGNRWEINNEFHVDELYSNVHSLKLASDHHFNFAKFIYSEDGRMAYKLDELYWKKMSYNVKYEFTTYSVAKIACYLWYLPLPTPKHGSKFVAINQNGELLHLSVYGDDIYNNFVLYEKLENWSLLNIIVPSANELIKKGSIII